MHANPSKKEQCLSVSLRDYFAQKSFHFFLSSTKAVIGMLCKEVSMCKRVEITKNSFTGSFPFAPPPPQQGH